MDAGARETKSVENKRNSCSLCDEHEIKELKEVDVVLTWCFQSSAQRRKEMMKREAVMSSQTVLRRMTILM